VPKRGASSLITIRLAIDPWQWRDDDKAAWALALAKAADEAAPLFMRVKSYEVGDVLVHIRLRSDEEPARMRKLFREDEDLQQLMAWYAELGARADVEVEADPDAAD
jgi:hypothetical protein